MQWTQTRVHLTVLIIDTPNQINPEIKPVLFSALAPGYLLGSHIYIVQYWIWSNNFVQRIFILLGNNNKAVMRNYSQTLKSNQSMQ